MTPTTRRRVRRALGVTGLAGAVLLTFGGLAQAGPEGAQAIHACVNKATGDVRIPNSHRHGGCGPFERSVVWNVRGPRGPQGPSGLTGGRTITRTIDVPANSTGQATEATCPDGMVATGGGFAFGSPDLSVQISRPEPATANRPPTGWLVGFTNRGPLPLPAEVSVVCY